MNAMRFIHGNESFKTSLDINFAGKWESVRFGEIVVLLFILQLLRRYASAVAAASKTRHRFRRVGGFGFDKKN